MGDEMKNKVEILNRGDTDVVVATVDGKTVLPPQARIAFKSSKSLMVGSSHFNHHRNVLKRPVVPTQHLDRTITLTPEH